MFYSSNTILPPVLCLHPEIGWPAVLRSEFLNSF